MKTVSLHRVCWSCPDRGNVQAWFTTWNKAMAFARQHRVSDSAYLEVVEVPTGKLALAEWLNANVDTDNG